MYNNDGTCKVFSNAGTQQMIRKCHCVHLQYTAQGEQRYHRGYSDSNRLLLLTNAGRDNARK